MMATSVNQTTTRSGGLAGTAVVVKMTARISSPETRSVSLLPWVEEWGLAP
jgi:hypothetical protein